MRPAMRLHLVVALLAAGACSLAHADIYSFVDSAGVTHFTNVPVDGRSRLVPAPPPEGRAAPPGHYRAKPAEFEPLIEQAARSQALRPELVRAVIVVESA